MAGSDRHEWLKRVRDLLLGEELPEQAPVPEISQEQRWDETAEELLSQTKLAASQEEVRADSLIARAGVLLGFCGAAVAISAGTAKELLAQSRELGEPAREVAAASLIAGLILVVTAALAALSAMHPKRGRAMGVEEHMGFGEPEAYKKSRFEYRRSLQVSLARALKEERPKKQQTREDPAAGIDPARARDRLVHTDGGALCHRCSRRP